MITDEQVEEAFETLRASAKSAATARANRLWIEKFLDVKLALLEKDFEDSEFDKIAANKLTREALAHPEYRELLDGWRDAVFLDEFERNQRNTAASLIDAWRTQSATERATRI